MQEKYYIDIDENRKILSRYLKSIHGENIPSTALEVSEATFNISIQENHNFIDENGVTGVKDFRTDEEKKEIRKAEILAELTQIDLKSVRPMSAIIDGTAVEKDRDILRELRASATILRTELSTL